VKFQIAIICTLLVLSVGNLSSSLSFFPPLRANASSSSFIFGVEPMNNNSLTPHLSTAQLQEITNAHILGGSFETPGGEDLSDATLVNIGFNMNQFIVSLDNSSSTISSEMSAYDSNVHMWQFYDEPNGCSSGQSCFSASNAEAQMQTLYGDVHSVQSNAVVLCCQATFFQTVNGQIAFNVGGGYTWWQDFASAGGCNYIDAVTIHTFFASDTNFYSNTTAQSVFANDLTKIYAVCGKPMYDTSVGWFTGAPETSSGQLLQAQNWNATLKILTSDPSQIYGAYYYQPQDWSGCCTSDGMTYGLFNDSWTAKLIVQSYSNFITAYQGSTTTTTTGGGAIGAGTSPPPSGGGVGTSSTGVIAAILPLVVIVFLLGALNSITRGKKK
jgi:hypothetical protein